MTNIEIAYKKPDTKRNNHNKANNVKFASKVIKGAKDTGNKIDIRI